jgi:hypothetical protein
VNGISKIRIVQACPAEQTGRVYRPDRAGNSENLKCTQKINIQVTLTPYIYVVKKDAHPTAVLKHQTNLL